jgi:hypothetical protein
MKLSPEDRQDVYLCFEYVYKHTTGSKLKWEAGEKRRVAQIFTKLCEDLSIRDSEYFPNALQKYEEYLKIHSAKWVKWAAASRSNYIGFLYNRDNISIFAAASRPSTVAPEIAGFSGADAWDF